MPQATLWLFHGNFSRQISHLSTTDPRSYRAFGRELDEILAGEVGRVSRMADLKGPSGPNACEAMNPQLYCQTAMLRQNQLGKEMKLKRKGFCSSLHPTLSSVDRIKLYVACTYFKATNTFSLPTQIQLDRRTPLVLISLCSQLSPHVCQHQDGLSPGRMLARQMLVTGMPFVQHRQHFCSSNTGTAGPQSCYPSKSNSQLQGAKENCSLHLQSLLSTHGSTTRCTLLQSGRQIHVIHIPSPSTPTCSLADGNRRMAWPWCTGPRFKA